MIKVIKLVSPNGNANYVYVDTIFCLTYNPEQCVGGSVEDTLPEEYKVRVTCPDNKLIGYIVTEESFSLALEAFKKWCD